MKFGFGSARIASGVLGVAILILGGCGSAEPVGEYPDRRRGDSTPYEYKKREQESIFGPRGLTLGVGGDEAAQSGEEGGGALGVNSFLWRGSLDTLTFMPIASADPFGGVILTEWYAMPEAPDERFKMNVYILGRSLRADGVRVAVFRQIRDRQGNWVDAAVPPDAGTRIEDSILTRARQLRFAALAR